MKETQNTLIAVRVTEELARLVRLLANADERSVSSFIKIALKHEIERTQKRQSHRHQTAA